MRFLLVDDHAIVRHGVAALLQASFCPCIVEHAASISGAKQRLGVSPAFDALLLDLIMPLEDASDGLRYFGQHHPSMPVIVLSSSEAEADVRRCINLGAMGYIGKSASPRTFIAAINFVLAGEVYLPSFLVDSHSSRDKPSPMDPPGATSRLTPRQISVLQHLKHGVPNKRIAYELGISEKTVKSHITAIFRALGLSSRTELTHAFVRKEAKIL